MGCSLSSSNPGAPLPPPPEGSNGNSSSNNSSSNRTDDDKAREASRNIDWSITREERNQPDKIEVPSFSF